MHDHHCQCDRCCVARRASRDACRERPLIVAFIWTCVVWIFALVLRCANG